MRGKEWRQFRRLREIIEAIPFPAGYGTSTASLRGFATYARDMREARPLIAGVLQAQNLEDRASALAELEDWLHDRQAKGWA